MTARPTLLEKPESFNVPSDLLTKDENQKIFELLGDKRLTQATAVVQLFSTESPGHSKWIKRFTGILCFVRDSVVRSYFLRMYSLNRNKMVWEQELYECFMMTQPQSYLLVFPAQDYIVAFNFVLDDEANKFFKVVQNCLENRKKRQQKRLERSTRKSDEAIQIRSPKPKRIPSTPVKPLKLHNKRLTKEDIGMPSGFKHLVHMGYGQKHDFSLEKCDEALKEFLSKAGVSDQQMGCRNTMTFIYDFIQTNDVLGKVKAESSKPSKGTKEAIQAKSPEPRRVSTKSRAAPLPPPMGQRHMSMSVQSRSAPPPPSQNSPGPSPTHTTGAPLPPPPPPPMLEMLPSESPKLERSKNPPKILPLTPDPRDALLESIRKGTSLKEIPKSPNPKRIESTCSMKNDTQIDTLASTLRKALEQRKDVIQDDSDGNGSDDLENDDEWDD